LLERWPLGRKELIGVVEQTFLFGIAQDHAQVLVEQTNTAWKALREC
jgi:hypothetical protein